MSVRRRRPSCRKAARCSSEHQRIWCQLQVSFPGQLWEARCFLIAPFRSESSTPVLLRLHYKCPFQDGGRAAAQGRYPHGLKQQHPEGRKIPECSFYSWTDVAPVQPAEAAAERRDRDRTEVSCA